MYIYIIVLAIINYDPEPAKKIELFHDGAFFSATTTCLKVTILGLVSDLSARR